MICDLSLIPKFSSHSDVSCVAAVAPHQLTEPSQLGEAGHIIRIQTLLPASTKDSYGFFFFFFNNSGQRH